MRSDEAPKLAGVSLRLRLARQMRGMTLKGLAEAAGCSESMLSKVENGKTSPSLPMLHRLVGALGTNIGWMFEENHGEDGIVFRAGELRFRAAPRLPQRRRRPGQRVLGQHAADVLTSAGAFRVIFKAA